MSTYNTVIINFIAVSSSKELSILLDEGGMEAYANLMLTFAKEIDTENHKVVCEALCQNSPELREKVAKYVDNYKVNNPRINKMNDYFKSLAEGENFFIYPTDGKMSTEQFEAMFDYLVALRDGKTFEEVKAQTEDLFGELRELYDIKVFGYAPINIGEPDKTKRVCRFCGKDADHTEFKKKAHTISKSLGNNYIVTNDECDCCNQTFGNTIECDLAEFLGVFRSMFGMRGYNGIPHIKGSNFDIKNDGGTVKLNFIASSEEEEKMPVENMQLPLKSGQQISLQNVYRSIVKYSLSVIDAAEMKHFRDTVEWIFGRKKIEYLPQVAVLQVPEFFDMQPKMNIYMRKTEDRHLPYCVAEFHFAHIVMVAIIPASDMDAVDFTSIGDYNNFWQTFKHFNSTPGWEFKDYSREKKDFFTTDFNISKVRYGKD